MVQFLVDNALGKLYLEMYPDSRIKERYKIANAPASGNDSNSNSSNDSSSDVAPIRKRKPLHEIKIIDPACGSGNFLLYAFDLFYDLYLDQIENYDVDDYDEKDIPKWIIEHNLHGIDLDDRAVQLAQLGLFIKAKKKRRTIGALTFNVVSSDFFLPDYKTVEPIFIEGARLDASQRELIADIWTDIQFAHRYGSLIRLNDKLKAKLSSLIQKRFPKQSPKAEQASLFSDEELGIPPAPPKSVQMGLFDGEEIEKEEAFIARFFKNLKTAVEKYARSEGNSFLTSKTRDAITFLELLTTDFDVATANPPYTDSSDFGPDLKKFIEANYKKPHKFHTNLYATFIKRCYEMTVEDGKIAMIHPHTFMFIKTFEDVRKFMINQCHIDAMVDFGLDRVNLFGPGILLDATFYVLSKGRNDKDGLYFNLTANLQEKYKKNKFLEALDDYISSMANDRIYTLEQTKLKIIKSWPFIYWISDEFREKFKLSSIADFADIKSGLLIPTKLSIAFKKKILG